MNYLILNAGSCPVVIVVEHWRLKPDVLGLIPGDCQVQ